MFDYTGFYTIVLTKLWRNQYIIISKILNDCWSVYITNVMIVVSMESELDSRSAIYTYFPYTLHHCEKTAPVVLNYFINNSFLYDTDHFPDKLKNMYKCPLTLVTHNVTPFMILYRNHNDRSYRTEGIDGITFRVLSQQLNFTPIIEVPNKTNGSSYFMEMVMTGRANLTIGAFSFTIKRAETMSASSPYLYSSILFAVPKGKAYTALQKLFLPFKMQIWIVMAIMLLCALIATTFLSETKLKFLTGECNRTPFLNTISVLFGGVVTVLPKRNFARTILIIWIFGCIVLRSAFDGSLFEFIQKPRNLPSARTFPELIARNYTLYMTTSIYQLLNSSKYYKK
ncbi:hypothetical protein HA402_007193 [Bradysia odoriphaga]|nr:hypothetical protein HA402_007193 [Bradysia odoriphaga]